MKKRWRLLAMLQAVLVLQTACSSGQPVNQNKEPEASDSLTAGAYTLQFEAMDGQWGIQIADGSGTQFINATPMMVTTIVSEDSEPIISAAGYESVESLHGTVIGRGTVHTEDGAAIDFVDTYSVSNEAFLMERAVSVAEAGTAETGFATTFSISDLSGGTRDDYEYFIPSIIYKNNTCLKRNSIFASLTAVNYVKETRCGTPLAMFRGKEDGYAVALVHVNPQLSGTADQLGAACLISDEQLYGSLGFTLEGRASVDFVWPSTETPNSYLTEGTVRRYHPLEPGREQHYTLGMIPNRNAVWNTAMVETYLSALSLSEIRVDTDVDLNRVYDLNMELYDALYLKYEGSQGKYAAGYPFAVNVVDFDKYYEVSFQMGFIGAQTAIAAELVREGIRSSNQSALEKGTEILNFWTSETIFSEVLPTVWWKPAEGGDAGSHITYPAFLRCFVDGAEGLLNACLYAAEADLDVSAWETAIIRIADFLAENQNDDGSYYRAYWRGGKPASESYQSTSKLNTPIAVRFLCRMYAYTGNESYRTAAERAAEYCYQELYEKLGQYVGGTPDNPNVPDKEAAIYALYAFSAIYDLTGDERYYAALEHAAVCAMSWVYTYDYAVRDAASEEYAALNIFADGGNSGWSVIATGHSAIDVFGSNAYYELFRQYLRSGNETYLTVAELLQNHTAKAMDLDGSRGYLYGGFALEASNTADWMFFTAENGVWLPWIAAALMEPLIQTAEQFGDWDLDALVAQHSLDELRVMQQN